MVGLATCDVQEVVAPPFPKWYVEIDIRDSERGRLMDEVRTALLDLPDRNGIKTLYYGCILIVCVNIETAVHVAEHLDAKGFSFMLPLLGEIAEIRSSNAGAVIVKSRA
ncbi:hypothetical protein LCGC14_3106570 [marine sediment metagenome]|uniref:Uncharacterized protein n=1 Tax=marine sediment metagenome TaxID=412755 RepID=A0A0F8YW81_9ZZZZ